MWIALNWKIIHQKISLPRTIKILDAWDVTCRTIWFSHYVRLLSHWTTWIFHYHRIDFIVRFSETFLLFEKFQFFLLLLFSLSTFHFKAHTKHYANDILHLSIPELLFEYKFSNINANCWKSDFKLTICLKYDWMRVRRTRLIFVVWFFCAKFECSCFCRLSTFKIRLDDKQQKCHWKQISKERTWEKVIAFIVMFRVHS